MSQFISSLFKPLQLGATTIKNRVAMAPLTRNHADPVTKAPTALTVEYYAQRARGGAGLILTEGTLITPQGTEWQDAPGIWSEEQTVGWKAVTDAVHANGSKIFVQLWHLRDRVLGPSAIATRGGKFRFLSGEPAYVKPTAIEDPQVIIEQFKTAAINAKKAGFDGVELHGAGGYLPAQFMCSSANTREDKWGGSVENRARFGLEALKALIDVWGSDRVGIKLAPCGGINDVGMPLAEQIEGYAYFISEVEKLNLAYVQFMRYLAMLDVEFDGVMRGVNHDLLETYGPLLKETPIVLNVDVTPEEGSSLIASGKISAMSVGRDFISHADYARRVRYGKKLDNQLNWMASQMAGETPSVGYTDYPEAEYTEEEVAF